MLEEYKLTDEEKIRLKELAEAILDGELAQAQDLIKNCKSKYQFAKTHSAYVKDWEKTRSRMEGDLQAGKIPPGVSASLHRALIKETDKIIEAKLETVRDAFSILFGESIYNYLGKDGKTKFLSIF